MSDDIEIIATEKTVWSARYTRYVEQICVEVLAEQIDNHAPMFRLVIKSKNGRDSSPPEMTKDAVVEVLKTMSYMVQNALDET